MLSSATTVWLHSSQTARSWEQTTENLFKIAFTKSLWGSLNVRRMGGLFLHGCWPPEGVCDARWEAETVPVSGPSAIFMSQSAYETSSSTPQSISDRWSLKFGIRWLHVWNVVSGQVRWTDKQDKVHRHVFTSGHFTSPFSSLCSGSKHSSVQPRVFRGVNPCAILQKTVATWQSRTMHEPRVCAGSHWFHIWEAQLDCGRGPRPRLVHWSCCRVHQEKERSLPQPDGGFLGDRPVQRGHLLGSDLASRQAGAETETREDYCKTGLW